MTAATVVNVAEQVAAVRVLTYRPSAKSDEVSVTVSEAGAIAFEHVAPCRPIRSYRSQRNYCGDWWLATINRHVTFESWCERDHLIAFDFDPDVFGVAAQPFGLRFVSADGAERGHTPDFFVRMADRSAVVVDVRPDTLIDAGDQEKFDVTAAVCRLVGWGYRRVGERAEPWITNVRWLAGYRHARACNRSIAAAVRSVVADDGPMPLGAVAHEVGEPIVVLPTIFHMLWSHQLVADLASRRLSFNTAIGLPGLAG